MTKLDQLFIRACKSKKPEQRVLSVYRRFYLFQTKPEVYAYIAQILAIICDKYAPITTYELIHSLSPGNKWKYTLEGEVHYYRFCMKVLISKIRFIKATDFPGLTTPAMFRNKEIY